MVSSVPVHIPKSLRVTDDQFLEIVKANPELRLERTATGELIVMTPTGSESGNYNSELTTDVTLWNRQHPTGKVFDSSTGFRLPNGAIRSPDIAWVASDRWNALTTEQRKGFAPICPDFVIELVSETDTLEDIQAKMQEYIENGCRLGWLINPRTKTVEIYRPSQPPVTVSFSTPLSGEDVLPGFVLNLQTIFQD
ncbi:Uma2 family endonuclease [Leptothermofonsia sichuanensis E412]|uniref:Uma2 family endonuclease n=1 Tax=Leptothermofonsia sichuanensis TaxID=2917832 RepID=UPI001CA6B93E|nr:Uma2 family endonuclease [Leptothermofonsia sichuanensis]QZZ22747.1 Uma2 family endonuclease [Leptothermofonsia sichuanensis E412]